MPELKHRDKLEIAKELCLELGFKYGDERVWNIVSKLTETYNQGVQVGLTKACEEFEKGVTIKKSEILKMCESFTPEWKGHKRVSILTLKNILGNVRFDLQDEKELQSQIEQVLKMRDIIFEREYKLDQKNIPDFFIDGTVIEIKIKGNAKSIYKQCERYAGFDQVKEIFLMTNRSMGFPETLNNKPCYVMKLGNAWL